MKSDNINIIKELLGWKIHPSRKKFFLMEKGYKNFEKKEAIEEDLFIELLNGKIGTIRCLGASIKKIEAELLEGVNVFVFYVYVQSETAYVSDLPVPDSLFNHEIVSHGLAAYTKSSNDISIIRNLRNIIRHNDIEICCSHKTQHIGPVGIYVAGTMKFISNIDLSSAYDDHGRYIYSHYWKTVRIYSKEQIDLKKHSHMEYILTPQKICGIWYKKNISLELYSKLQEIANQLRVKMYLID